MSRHNEALHLQGVFVCTIVSQLTQILSPQVAPRRRREFPPSRWLISRSFVQRPQCPRALAADALHTTAPSAAVEAAAADAALTRPRPALSSTPCPPNRCRCCASSLVT